MKKSTVRLLARSNRPVCIARTSTNAGHGEVLTPVTVKPSAPYL